MTSYRNLFDVKIAIVSEMSNFSSFLPESEFKHRLVYITPDKVDSPVVLPHNLPGDAEVIAAEWMYHPYHFEMYQS